MGGKLNSCKIKYVYSIEIPTCIHPFPMTSVWREVTWSFSRMLLINFEYNFVVVWLKALKACEETAW